MTPSVAPSSAQALRHLVQQNIPQDPFGTTLSEGQRYLPAGHLKALDPARPLVVGARGVGKTFWWSTLVSRGGESLLTALFREPYEVRAAFGDRAAGTFERPGTDTIESLFEQAPARTVWKTFLLASALDSPPPGPWSQRVAWVREHPEESDLLLAQQDARLHTEGKKRLVLFDAIDRDPPDWSALVKRHGALLRLLLDCQRFRALRVKAFVRRDIMDDPAVTAFPDASKLRANQVALVWSQADLYALLWQYLANGPIDSTGFRWLCTPDQSWTNARSMPAKMAVDMGTQKRIWHRLAGPYMGAGARKGDTYRWLFNHLGDAAAQVSPRSFLTAVRVAAEETQASAVTAIHYTALQEGVRQAALIRTNEIEEDFPWMGKALTSLEELLVPCERSVIKKAWKDADLEAQLDTSTSGRRRRSHGQGLDALLGELISSQVFQALPDARINVPDVFRLGFRMLRKGGVRVRAVASHLP